MGNHGYISNWVFSQSFVQSEQEGLSLALDHIACHIRLVCRVELQKLSFILHNCENAVFLSLVKPDVSSDVSSYLQFLSKADRDS